MNSPNLVRLGMIFIAIISLFLLPKQALKRFLPTSIFTSFLVIFMCTLAVPYKWWKVTGGIKGKVLNDASFILGPFFAGTLWIFHLTYGNFKVYALVNFLFDWAFSYPLNHLFQKWKLYKLLNFKQKHILLFFTSYSFIIYFFQGIIEIGRKNLNN
ncbi:hypothetical protein G8O30_00855 [Mangrovibacillus cuniculi]|uniref:Permease n=1 Tax=Mangrovibacillus cuniculi TaxID=2593652 RepID=A0A7S8HH61_9BACI|nr:hypothetical protein G8O30_00855 [Mangrovibacillus cuniculi]